MTDTRTEQPTRLDVDQALPNLAWLRPPDVSRQLPQRVIAEWLAPPAAIQIHDLLRRLPGDLSRYLVQMAAQLIELRLPPRGDAAG
jgi:hypothetical protein